MITRLHRQRTLVLIAALAGMSVTFLPWYRILGGRILGTDDHGWLTLALFLAASILALTGTRRASLPRAQAFAIAGMGIAAAATGLLKIVLAEPTQKVIDRPGDQVLGTLQEPAFSHMTAAEREALFAERVAFEVVLFQEVPVPDYGLFLLAAAGLAIPLIVYALRD